MSQSKCLVCGCVKFYAKNPEDEYDTYEFECRDGNISPDTDPDEAFQKIAENSEIYCNDCTWHDTFGKIK